MCARLRLALSIFFVVTVLAAHGITVLGLGPKLESCFFPADTKMERALPSSPTEPIFPTHPDSDIRATAVRAGASGSAEEGTDSAGDS